MFLLDISAYILDFAPLPECFPSPFHCVTIRAIVTHLLLHLFRLPQRKLWQQLQRDMWRRLQSCKHVQPCQRNVFLCLWQLETTNVCKWDTFDEYTSECWLWCVRVSCLSDPRIMTETITCSLPLYRNICVICMWNCPLLLRGENTVPMFY